MSGRSFMNSQQPHLILIGGFLGAGKTAAMVAFAHWLADQGIRAGFVTNDQGSDLVDTRLLKYCGMATEEIAGGCFCCRFNELVDATERLRAVMQPDVFVAEAVGSCTDLAATVTYPMRRLLGDQCTVAPLSVLVDPVRARRAFGLDDGDTFSENVQYIYRKQLEEADVIVISKCDGVAAQDLDELRDRLRREFPSADVIAVSVREGTNLDAWFRRVVFDQQRPRTAMDLDYDRYADGESRLGWLNASVRAESPAAADGNVLLEQLALILHRRLGARGIAVAHLKMTLHSGNEMAAVHLVRNDFVPELGARLDGPLAAATITINLRAEAAPAALQQVLMESLVDGTGWRLELDHVEAFRPERPVPTHRDGITPSST